MGVLVFASLVTLTILASFVFAVMIVIAVYLNELSLTFAVVLTLITNTLLWLLGPIFTDWMLQLFLSAHFQSKEEFRSRHPAIAELILKISSDYGFPFPN